MVYQRKRKTMSFVERITDFVRQSRSAVTSLSAASVGTALQQTQAMSEPAVNTFFQHMAWTVGIVAGLLSIAKYIRDLRRKPPKTDE